MFECNKPESTARMQIASLKYSPLLNINENSVTFDKKMALELEYELEFIFEWSQYDRRCEQIEGFEKEEKDFKKEIKHNTMLYLAKCEKQMLADKLQDKSAELVKTQEQLTKLQNEKQAIKNIITERKSIKNYSFIKRWKIALQALDKIGSIVETSVKTQF